MIAAENVRYLHALRVRIGQEIFGLDHVIGALVSALISDGHVLLEGNPGVGKTGLVRALGAASGFRPDRVGRIQFTPDLMPADITGTLLPEPTPANPHGLAFRHGPIFHWLLLADEINRATPKTQAAMLEAMAERQVTVLGETYPLSPPQGVTLGQRRYRARPPFMVLATQNPIDHEGTYELPEAQADRFLFKIRIPAPDIATLARIVAKETGPPSTSEAPVKPDEEAALARLHEISLGLRHLELPDMIQQHILNLVVASGGELPPEADVPPSRARLAADLAAKYFSYPLGPRAASALTAGTRAWAVTMLAPPGEPELGGVAGDALARVLAPALRHRLQLRLGWRRDAEREFPEWAALGNEAALDRLIVHFATLVAPGPGTYSDTFRGAADAALAHPL